MHMADALISPSVGVTVWALSGGWIAYCARKVKASLDDHRVPLMGVLGAFIFAVQMINFTIPGTGSSGHLGGGLILAVLLGPHSAFLVIASVLTVQALFFADGGLLALGCNILNLGFFPAFLAYPLVYRVIARDAYGTPRAWAAAILAAVVGLQLGAMAVVLQTTASGVSDLPFSTFLLMMLPIHLAIGIVEGAVTATVIAFVVRARPEILLSAPRRPEAVRLRPVLAGLLIAAGLLGGLFSWFASANPDGLEWAIAKVTGEPEAMPPADTGLHQGLASVQDATAILPDYGFRPDSETSPAPGMLPDQAGTAVSGIVGGLLTLGIVCLAGAALKTLSRIPASGHG